MVTFLEVGATSGLGFSLVPYLKEFAGLTTPQAAGVLSISTFLALSSLLWGQLAARLTARWCIVGALALSAAAALALLRVDSLPAAYLFGVLWGLFHSGLEVLRYIFMADYYGRDSYGAIAGTMRPFEAGGLGVGQLVGPLIYDFTGSYTLLILSSATLLIVSAALMLLARRPVMSERLVGSPLPSGGRLGWGRSSPFQPGDPARCLAWNGGPTLRRILRRRCQTAVGHFHLAVRRGGEIKVVSGDNHRGSLAGDAGAVCR